MNEKEEIEINNFRNVLMHKIDNSSTSAERSDHVSDLHEFDFIVKNIDMFDWKAFSCHNLSVPSWSHPIFKKHLVFLKRHCEVRGVAVPRIIQSKFKFGSWRIYFESSSTASLDTMFYVLVDNLCIELERAVLLQFKK